MWATTFTVPILKQIIFIIFINQRTVPKVIMGLGTVFLLSFFVTGKEDEEAFF